MSINIQTNKGLLEIGGSVTKDKIIEKLGYTPADESHVSDTDGHVSKADRANWNNKDYGALENAPNIVDDGSDTYYIVDKHGNVILRVDKDGVHTTDIEAGGEYLGKKIKEHIASKHVTSYHELSDAPNVVDDGSGEYIISDKAGNIIAKFTASGLDTVGVMIKGKSILEGMATEKFVEQKISEAELSGGDGESVDLSGYVKSKELSDHTGNTDVHVSANEKNAWNNKSNFSGNYNDLADKPNIQDDKSDEYVITDGNGNIVARISSTGIDAVGFFKRGVPLPMLPDVTEEDNGKFARVVDGTWQAVSLENAEDGEY